MLLRLIEEKYPLDAVVFYDTGMEFDSIYHIRDRIKPILQANNISFVELHPKRPFLYDMLEHQIKYRYREGYHTGYGWCGGVCRWGTRTKVRAIQHYKHSIADDVIDYVGIAADEFARFEKEKSPEKRFPLVEWGMTESDCLCHCRTAFIPVKSRSPAVAEGQIDLYDILDRVSCWCCSNKNQKELRNIYTYLPQYWERLKYLQSRIESPMKKYVRNGVPYGNVFEMEKVFQEETK